MAVKVLAYVPFLRKEILPEIVARFRDVGMQVQFHPAFDPYSLSKDAAMVPLQMCMESADSRYGPADVSSELEVSSKDFRYASPLSVNPAVNQKLKACTKVITIRMHSTHTSAFRVGLYFAAFLAQVTDGIVYTPRSDAYLEPEQAIAQFANEIAYYESELPPQDWRVVPFEDW